MEFLTKIIPYFFLNRFTPIFKIVIKTIKPPIDLTDSRFSL